MGGLGGEHENARANDGPDAQQGELPSSQGAMKAFFLGRRENDVERLDTPENHAEYLIWVNRDTSIGKASVP